LRLFQSLIGIIDDFDCRPLKRLLYLVFKVRLRQPPLTIAFQPSSLLGLGWFRLSKPSTSLSPQSPQLRSALKALNFAQPSKPSKLVLLCMRLVEQLGWLSEAETTLPILRSCPHTYPSLFHLAKLGTPKRPLFRPKISHSFTFPLTRLGICTTQHLFSLTLFLIFIQLQGLPTTRTSILR